MRPVMTAIAGAAMAVFLAAAAVAEDAAEAFVQEHASEALLILNDGELALTEKKDAFQALIDDIADVPKITRFVLGRYARGIDEQAYAEFAETFREYATGVYEDRLGDYAGEDLVVTGSTSRKPGDVIVHSEVRGGAKHEPLTVNWRVLTDEEGTMKVVDAEVYGVWLALNQREEITTLIGNAGGRVSAATEALKANIMARAAAAG